MHHLASRDGRARSSRVALGLAAAALLGACAEDDAADRAAPPDTPAAAEAEPPTRPAERTDTILLEGTPEPMPVRLFTWEGEGALPVSFYVPEGMEVEEMPEGGGAAVRVTAAFAGVPDTAAYLHVYAHPAGRPEEQARQHVQGILTGLQVPVSKGIDEDQVAGAGTGRTDRFPWALAERVFRIPPVGAPELVGALGFGEHRGRYFHVLYRYPPEYGDGMGPRIDAILSSWRWEDSGEMLGASGG